MGECEIGSITPNFFERTPIKIHNLAFIRSGRRRGRSGWFVSWWQVVSIQGQSRTFLRENLHKNS